MLGLTPKSLNQKNYILSRKLNKEKGNDGAPLMLVFQPPLTHHSPKRKERLMFNPYIIYYTSLINLVNRFCGKR
jgi:hypothetical protein